MRCWRFRRRISRHIIPAYFYAAVLSHEAEDSAKVYKYSTELKSMGLELLPPDVNESDEGFTPVDDAVRYGLTAIKGMGTSSVQAIVEARKDGHVHFPVRFLLRGSDRARSIGAASKA